MRFEDLLARADDSVLQELIGGPALRLLNALDPSLSLPSKLKAVLVGLYGQAGLLSDTGKRRVLMDLLRPLEARQLAEALGLTPVSDPYASLRQLRVAKRSVREETLFSYFGLDAPAAEVSVAPPTENAIQPTYALFPYQRRAVERVLGVLGEEPHRVLLHMPTGAGKTRTAMSAIAQHLRAHEPGLVLWLAYSEELCDQAAEEFTRSWQSLGNRELTIRRFWGQLQPDLGDLRDGMVVAGLAKMYALAQSSIYQLGQLGSRASLIIMDEAHQAIAPTYRLVLEALTVHGTRPGLLGLTATPGRTWADIDADEELSAFFGRKKVMLEVEGYGNPVDYLVDAGYLARANFESLLVQTGFTLSEADLVRLKESLDVPENVLRRLADDEQRNLAIINRLEALVEKHRRILLFATTVEHSQLIATVLQARGIEGYSITGRTPPSERVRRIQDFRRESSESQVLCNYGVLTTGFDAPKTSAVVIARPTKSLVLYSQMVGRAIRGPKAGGNAQAEVVTVVDSALPGFGNVAEAFTNWEDVWK